MFKIDTSGNETLFYSFSGGLDGGSGGDLAYGFDRKPVRHNAGCWLRCVWVSLRFGV